MEKSIFLVVFDRFSAVFLNYIKSMFTYARGLLAPFITPLSSFWRREGNGRQLKINLDYEDGCKKHTVFLFKGILNFRTFLFTKTQRSAENFVVSFSIFWIKNGY